MKLSHYNTTTACNHPRKMSLRDPFTGDLLIDDDGKTIDFYIYGSHSDIARNADKERERAMSDGKKTEAEKIKIGSEFIATLIQGWTPNVEDDNGPLEFNNKNAISLLMAQDWIASQVMQFHLNLGNYDPKRYSRPEAGSEKERGSTGRRKAAKSPDIKDTLTE